MDVLTMKESNEMIAAILAKYNSDLSFPLSTKEGLQAFMAEAKEALRVAGEIATRKGITALEITVSVADYRRIADLASAEGVTVDDEIGKAITTWLDRRPVPNEGGDGEGEAPS